ncbi:glycosyltransferase family 2 protein [Candidatus Sumerlaeota bacterium]|nr:glycosyltransferase family 2 protein [Candidatus Sumerlaeota bacterium]
MTTHDMSPSPSSPGDERPEFSVIITCHYEEKSIGEFSRRLISTMGAMGRTHEIIFVNDGSTDGTFDHLREIIDANPSVTAIADIFRNSGQANAISAGISLARGRNHIFIDSDLQLDPEELPRLIEVFDQGFDIVSGYRSERQDTALRSIPSKFANMVMRRIAGHRLRDFGCTFKVFNGRLIAAFDFGPHQPFNPAYVFSRAGRCAEVPITHHPRRYGRSGWRLRRLLDYFTDNLVGVSHRPFQYLFFLCLIAAGLFMLRILFAWVADFTLIETITPGLILNVILVHLLLVISVLALVGEYVIRSFIRQRGHPNYVIRHLVRRDPRTGEIERE